MYDRGRFEPELVSMYMYDKSDYGQLGVNSLYGEHFTDKIPVNSLYGRHFMDNLCVKLEIYGEVG